ncbi:uncharacterized protein [Hemitrygon akajei]|uniref:uncharacterized protein n=1 Tax=Hemitrygon akajei TaxID=2704970 RepID=UPI003BF98B23
MDDSETYMNVKFTKTDSPSPSRAESDVSYAELNVKTLSAPRDPADGEGLNSTYSELNFRKEETRIDEDEEPSISSGPGRMTTTAQTALHPALVGTNRTHLVTQASSDNSCFSYLRSETQRILGRMDRSKSYMNVKLGKTDSRSPSRAEPDVSYAEVNFKTPSASRVRTDRDGLNSTYSELNFRNEEPRIAEDEDPPISSGPDGLSTTAQTGAQKQAPKQNTGNRSCRKNCLLCLVTFGLVGIVAGLSIYGMHSDLRHQFTELETKYRSVNETKARICELLTSRREQTCPQNWNENENRCYFISTFEKPYDGAREHCSNFDARLLEINSNQEEDFVSISIGHRIGTYWIGKCRNGNVVSNLLYKMFNRPPTCSKCYSSGWSYTYSCNMKHRFICEKATHLYPDIPEEIQDLCQQPVGPASVNSVASFLQEGDENLTPPSKRGLTDALYNFNVTSVLKPRCSQVLPRVIFSVNLPTTEALDDRLYQQALSN